MIVYARGKFCNETDTAPFLTVFALVGHCEEVLEKYIDTFAAYGSAIAFVSSKYPNVKYATQLLLVT